MVGDALGASKIGLFVGFYCFCWLMEKIIETIEIIEID